MKRTAIILISSILFVLFVNTIRIEDPPFTFQVTGVTGSVQALFTVDYTGEKAVRPSHSPPILKESAWLPVRL